MVTDWELNPILCNSNKYFLLLSACVCGGVFSFIEFYTTSFILNKTKHVFVILGDEPTTSL